MSNSFLILLIASLLGGAGVFMAFNALTRPHSVKLAKSNKGLLAALQRRLDAAELPVSAREFVIVCSTAAAVTAGVAILLGAPALAVAGVIICPALIWQRYESQHDNFRQTYDESLAECVQLVREGFSATGALAAALEHAAKRGPDPAAADLRDVWREQQMRSNLEEGFNRIIERRRNPYLRMVAEALTLKSQQGGSISEVLLGLETMIREQVTLRREINAKQAQARLEAVIVSLAPIGFFVSMKLLPWMRQYENGFYSTFLGQIVLMVALIFSVIAYILSRRLAGRGLTMEVKELPSANPAL